MNGIYFRLMQMKFIIKEGKKPGALVLQNVMLNDDMHNFLFVLSFSINNFKRS